jgi:hypothetical protein
MKYHLLYTKHAKVDEHSLIWYRCYAYTIKMLLTCKTGHDMHVHIAMINYKNRNCLPFASTWVHTRIFGEIRVDHLFNFCVALLCVFAFWIPCRDVRYDFRFQYHVHSSFALKRRISNGLNIWRRIYREHMVSIYLWWFARSALKFMLCSTVILENMYVF